MIIKIYKFQIFQQEINQILIIKNLLYQLSIKKIIVKIIKKIFKHLIRDINQLLQHIRILEILNIMLIQAHNNIFKKVKDFLL